jgi:hypothetical protein
MVNEIKFNNPEKEKLISKINEKLIENYVFPDVALKIGNYLIGEMSKGAYSNIENILDFCKRLTQDMQEFGKDKHLALIYKPVIDSPQSEQSLMEKILEDEQKRGIVDNYGFYKVERLPGNVGYIDLRRFYSINIGADTAISCFNAISSTDALIIDLRKNGGGRVEMVTFLASFLLQESTLFNSIYNRSEDTLTQNWTHNYTPGKKYLNKPVYILTSNYTFSGGEAFAYGLKNIGRVKIIGEVTGGGAHPVIFTQISEFLRLKVPNRRTIDPITNSNWEQVGVIPDVTIEEEKAFNSAYKEALILIREQYEPLSFYSYFIEEISTSLANLQ